MVIVIFFSICITFSTFGIVSIFVVVGLKKYKVRGILHLSWCFFMVLMIIGFICSALLVGLSGNYILFL